MKKCGMSDICSSNELEMHRPFARLVHVEPTGMQKIQKH